MKYPGWLSQPECDILERHAQDSRYNQVLEIGSLFGKSSLCIATGLHIKHGADWRLTCIDPWLYTDSSRPYPGVFFWQEMKRAGFEDNVWQYKDLSRNVMPLIANQKNDFVFVDGDHDAMPTLFDVTMAALTTRKILVHDYCSTSHMVVNKGVDAFLDVSGWKRTGEGGSIVVIEGDKYLPSPVYGDKKVPE